MILFECAPPFQWKPSYNKFGVFRRAMWGWFAVTHFSGGINELIEGIGRAAVALAREDGVLPPDADKRPSGIKVT